MQTLPPGFVLETSPQQSPTIGGTRVIGGVPPSERRAEEDQAIQREQLRIAQENAERARNRDARDQEEFEGTGGKPIEGDKKAAAFLIRALGSNRAFENTGEGARNIFAQAFQDARPDLANTILNSDTRQVANSAQDEFIAASLRQDSGAAIPEEELERQRRILFPIPGDGPDAIEQKRQARLRVIKGLEIASGPLRERAIADFNALESQFSKADAANDMDAAKRNEILGEALKRGASQAEILSIAKALGVDVDEAALEANIRSRDAGGPINSFISKETPPEENDEVNAELARQEELRGAPGFFDVAKSGLTLGLIDEASGVGQAIGGLLTGDTDVVGNFQLGRDVERARIEQGRERLGPVGSFATEALGGGAGILSKGGQVIRAGRAAAQAGNLTRQGVQGQLVKQATKEGAVIGGVGGFGFGEGFEGSTSNALVGAAGGALLGNLGQRAGNALANRPANPGAAVQQSADNLGIQTIPAVTGGTASRALTAGARQGFVSDIPISKAVTRMEGQGQAARERIAGEAGQVLDPEDAGNVVRQAANVYSERTSDIGGKLYDRAARRAGGASFPAPTAIAKADEWLGELGKSMQGTNGTIFKEVKALRDRMADGSFELMSIPRTRDELRAQIQERGLRGSTLDTAMKQILKASEDDILNGLRQAGQDDAANAFITANKFWQKRVETIDEVLEPILGKGSPRSGEKIVSAIERMANPKTGDSAQLRRLFDAMPEKEAQSVRATVINRMGRPTAGAADNADDMGFSFNTFLTNWNNMSPRAKATMFPKESRKALDDLVTVSTAVKQAGSAANTSNTTRALTVQAAITSLAFFEPLTAMSVTGGQYAVGRLLASPKFARILAGAPKVATPQARKAVATRLGNLAKAEPALAREIGLYQQAMNDNAGVAAAAEEPNQ